MQRPARTLSIGFVSLAGLLCLAAVPAAAGPPADPGRAPEYVEGRVVVGFVPGAAAGARAAAIERIGGRQSQVVGLGAHVITVPIGREQQAIEALERNPNVRYAELDYVYELAETPDDPSFGLTWGLHNTGQAVNGAAGTPDADIDAPEAWDVATGSSSIVVGVVDTGIDYNHPDLAANMWSNPGGIGGCPAGTHGYDAVSGDCDPLDDNNHGSHTSGTIGAVGDDGVGVAGINWDTSLMALKAFNASGATTSTSIADALGWALTARQAGVNLRVLNNSWGGWQFSQATLDLVNALAAEDVLFVAAAGNNGLPHWLLPFYPCDYTVDSIICVGASTQTDTLASFSDYGVPQVDLAAPGTNVYSTLRNGGYGFANGTSMATPHVTGAAALVLATDPSASVAEVRAAILGSVDVLASLSGKVATSGRLNLAAALGDTSPPPDVPGAPTLSGTPGDGSADLSWTTPDPGASPITAYRLYRTGGGPDQAFDLGLVTTYQDGGLVNGTTYGYRVSAVSDAGEGPKSNTVSLTPSAPATVPSAPGLSGVAGSGLAALCWQPPTSDGGSPITGYRLYRTAAGQTVTIDTNVTTSHTDTGLTNGTAYRYELVAINVVGAGPRSAPVDLTPPGSAPTISGFTPTIATGGSQITISGSGYAACGGSVRFGSVDGSIASATSSQLVATSPAAGGSGKVTVTMPGGTATSSTDFFAVPAGMTAAEVSVADRIAFDSAKSVALSTAGKAGLLLFDGTAGQRVSLRITSNISQTDVSIVNPNGTNLANPTMFTTSGGFIDTKVLGASGTYTIVVNPRSSYTGTVTLTLYDVPADVTGTITPGGAAVPVAIGTPGQNGAITFSGTAGQRVSLRITSNISQTDVSIVNPNGTNLANPTMFTTSGGFIDTKVLGASGTYTIVVNPRSSYTGTVTLTLYDVPADVTGTITPGGAAVPVAIGTPGQNGAITFSGTAGTSYSVVVSNSTITQTDVSVRRPDGTNIVNPTLVTNGKKTLTFTANVTGTYTIFVNPRSYFTGSLNIGL
jgi:subtilisin family serine protease